MKKQEQSSKFINSFELYRIINSGYSSHSNQHHQVELEAWEDNILRFSVPMSIMSRVKYHSHTNSVLREFTKYRYLSQANNLIYFGRSGGGRNGFQIEREKCVLLTCRERFLDKTLITVKLGDSFLQYLCQI